MTMGKAVTASHLDTVRRGTGGLLAWEPGDDLCPPWWPRRWPRPPLRASDVLIDIQALDRGYAALTLMASSFQWSDETLARDVRGIAIGHLRESSKTLGGGASAAWDDGDDWCPTPWHWRGPWPRWQGLAELLGHELLRPQPEPWAKSNPMPGRAVPLLDALRLLQAYNVAAMIDDGAARGLATGAIGKAFATHVDVVAHALG